MTTDSALKRTVFQRINFRIIAFAAVVLGLVGFPVYLYVDSILSGGVHQRGDLLEVDLKAMSNFPFDQADGTLNDIPPQWRALDGKRVLLYGEQWVPYSASPEISSFDLVYSITKCCFNGPPQVQHFVHSRTRPGLKVGYFSGLVRIVGVLRVNVTRGEGKVTGVYELDVESVQPVG